MGKISKRKKIIKKNIEKNKKYKLKEAIEKLKKNSLVKFCETVEIVIKLGRNVKKVKKNNIYLPYGLENNKKKIVVVKNNEIKEKILKLGIEIIGVDEIKKNKKQINYILCESESVKKIGEDIPKVLMINKENITKDILIKKGKINYCVDKNGIINTVIGKINFSIKEIKKNFNVLIKDVFKTVGNIKKIYISTTMGPGLIIDKSEYRKL